MGLAVAIALEAATLGAGNATLEGNWVVDSLGSDCVSTGWVQERYKPKYGKLVGTKVALDKKQLVWGKAKCLVKKVAAKPDTLYFFEGSQCSSTPGDLPKGCAALMDKLRGEDIPTASIECEGDELIPRDFYVLSDGWAVAMVEGDFICLKRAKSPGHR